MTIKIILLFEWYSFKITTFNSLSILFFIIIKSKMIDSILNQLTPKHNSGLLKILILIIFFMKNHYLYPF
jgi:hypothetical protein